MSGYKRQAEGRKAELRVWLLCLNDTDRTRKAYRGRGRKNKDNFMTTVC